MQNINEEQHVRISEGELSEEKKMQGKHNPIAQQKWKVLQQMTSKTINKKVSVCCHFATLH